MQLKLSWRLAVLLPLSLMASQSRANIITRALPLGGVDLNALTPGQEVIVSFRSGAIIAPLPDPENPGETVPQTFFGQDIYVATGGGGTFHAATVNNQHTSGIVLREKVDQEQKNDAPLQVGFGGWVEIPPTGSPTRVFTGIFNSAAVFSSPWTDPASINNATSRLLGTVALKAGNNPGIYNLSVGVLVVDGDYREIVGSQGQGFSYTVVPEPSSAPLFVMGLAGLFYRRGRI